MLYVPASATSTAALVIALHGDGDTDTNFIATSGLQALADTDGFVLVAPQGMTRDVTVGGQTVPQVDWDAYTVRLVERRVLPTDAPPGSFPTGSFTFDGAESKIERNPDGSLISLEIRSREAWRLVRIVVSHPSAEPARLQWEWDGSTRGGIAVIGLEADPRPNRSWRVLSQVIPLLRDWEWRRLGRTGRPPGQTTIQNDEQLRPSIAALRHDSRVVTVGHVAAHAGFTVAEVRGYLRVTGRTWREFIGDL